MPSSYSTNLKIELQATGENSGTWGTVTNTNLGTALEQAIVGYGNPDYLSDANLTLTYTDTNSAQTARALVLNVTSALSLTGTRELVVPTIQKQYIVQNNTTGSQSITVKTSAGTGITIPNGRKAHLYVDGTNVIYMDDYVDINGGAIDGTPVGANSASTGAFSTLSATGNVNFDGGTFTFNDSGADKDFRVEGDTDANLLFSDASTDRIGIGTNTPASKLDVNGTITATAVNTTTLDLTNLEVTNIKAKDGTSAASIADSTGVVSFTANPILSGGTANGVLFLNGSKVATSGSALAFDGTLLKVGSPTNAPNTNLSGNLLQIKSSSGFSYLTMGNGDGANNNTYIGSASSIATFGTVTDAGVTTELMRLTSSTLYTASGINVGIGTSSPSVRLMLEQAANSAPVTLLRLNNSGTTGGGPGIASRISFTAGATALGYIQGSNYASGATGLQFSGDGTNAQATLDTSGNLGIGTSSPSSFDSAWQRLVIGTGSGDAGQAIYSGSASIGSIAFADGTTGAQQYAGLIRYLHASDAMTFWAGATERMTLNSSGNLGLGVTPSAWGGGFKAIQMTAGASFGSHPTVPLAYVNANTFFDGSVNKYISSAFASRFISDGNAGGFGWQVAASGTAGNTISFTQAMTLDASGNLGVGTTSPTVRLSLAAASGGVWLGAKSGSNSEQLFGSDSSGNAAIFAQGSNIIALYTNATERARIDSSGNLFCGGTTGSSRLNLQTTTSSSADSNYITMYNAGENVGHINWINGNGDLARITGTKTGAGASANDGILTFSTATDTVLAERARITSGGDVGIGTTSPATRLDVQSSTTGGRNARFIDNSGVGSGGRGTGISLGGISNDTGPVITEYVRLVGLKTNATQGNTQGYLTFETDGGSGLVERARITSGGFFKASNTGTYSSSTNDRYEFTSDKNDLTILVNSTNTGANVNNVYSQLPAGANAGAYHFVGSISGSGLQFTVDADGDVKNTNNSYGSISDIKLKQDVVDATSQWDDIKALRVRKYRFKRNPDAALQIGLVAQEAEAVSPGLVEETADRDEEGNDLGTTTKSVKYSVLYMKAVKALQEAMTRIEQLEAKVAALESK